MANKFSPLSFAKTMRRLRVFILAAMLISACQPAVTPTPPPSAAAPSVASTDTPAPTATAAPTAAPTEPPTPTSITPPEASPTPGFVEPTISVFNHPTLGEILVGDNGMTLYIFTQDEPFKSNCDAACLEIWPPLLTQSFPNLGPGVEPSLVGTAALSDGSVIVTYNQMPLYYYSGDASPGEATGQAVGGVWFVLTPGGTAAMPPSANPTPQSAYDNNNNNNEKEDKDTDY
jgi:predicted lipoprotein with Yx(FWY)xxD motif